MNAAPPDIFISYAREDEAWVAPLAAALEVSGRSVFWDRRVPAGKTWRSHIGAALEQARCVVVVWSEHAVASKFVLEEAGEGKERDILVPVLRTPIRPPFGFREIHAADLSGWSPGRQSPVFDRFLADFDVVLGAPAARPWSGEVAPAKPIVREVGSADTAAPAGEPADKQALPPIPQPAKLGHFQDGGTRPATSSSGGSKWGAAGLWIGLAPLGAAAGAGGYHHLALRPLPPEGPKPELRPEAAQAPEIAVAAADRFSPGKVFRDCEQCPEMVVIPASSFTMGSPTSEEGRAGDEGPQREVTISQSFAIGRYEVTFAEWDACVAGGGCNGYRPADQGWGRGQQPVINVSWEDAQAFAAWLAEKTGEPYRLPTEAEWEYAARAGTTAPFWTGDTISTDQANYYGNYTYGTEKKGQYRQRTVAVDDPAFPANPFGLHHVHGNVWEWVQDCYRDSYDRAPTDGSKAVEGSDCPGRVLRGGSWDGGPGNLRSAYRFGLAPVGRDGRVGFRVARMLTP